MRFSSKVTLLVLSVTSASLSASAVATETINSKPRLILQITVDQLRGDLPDKFMKNMGEGGFRYLKKNGIWYANAHYGHSNTETVVGHTTLATGADPAEHGMVSNVWFDRSTQKLTYNVEDNRYHILSKGAGVDKNSEIDASQKLASTDGRSPTNIMVSTFSDELAMQSNGKAKIFAVSVKDRGAVTLAGHAGKAFWFSKSNGEFITSNYYYEKYPNWVNDWNKQKENHRFEHKSWKLLYDKSRYQYGDHDDQSWEVDVAGFGRTFPHQYGAADTKYFNNFLTFSPAGDELTLSFAKAIISAEKLGKDDVTDFLAISFSSTDYVGHLYGPSSLEAEDNMLRLDRTLANLFAYVDGYVGLENTLIVLSADHGGPDAPGYLKLYGIESGFVSVDKWDKSPSIQALKKHFGIDQTPIKSFFPPYVYLDHEMIKSKGLQLAEVEQVVADELMKIQGVAAAVSSSAIRKNRLPDTFLNRAAIRGYNNSRSGDILILFKPFYFFNDFHSELVAANHGGPWQYDTFVPIIFAGSNIKGKRINRKVEPKDIASTL
ncbi:MAG: alkaline phosphatase family protein, partial [Thiohalomonadales bacterium]